MPERNLLYELPSATIPSAVTYSLSYKTERIITGLHHLDIISKRNILYISSSKKQILFSISIAKLRHIVYLGAGYDSGLYFLIVYS